MMQNVAGSRAERLTANALRTSISEQDLVALTAYMEVYLKGTDRRECTSRQENDLRKNDHNAFGSAHRFACEVATDYE